MAELHSDGSTAKFDKWASTYDRSRMRPWFTRGQTRALDALDLRPDGWLLDVGCGTGRAVVQAAVEAVPQGGACGVDIAPAMIERAIENARGVPHVDFRVGDSQAIPYSNGMFDAIICTHSFHHYPSPHQALLEMGRVLRPGGQLAILDADGAACFWVRLWDMWNRAFERGHVRYHAVYELLGLMEQAGFRDIEIVSTEHEHFKHGKIGSATYLVRARKP